MKKCTFGVKLRPEGGLGGQNDPYAKSLISSRSTTLPKTARRYLAIEIFRYAKFSKFLGPLEKYQNVPKITFVPNFEGQGDPSGTKLLPESVLEFRVLST